MNQVCELNSCKELSDGNTVKGLFKFDNKFFVCTGTVSSGAEGWISASLYQAIPMELKLTFPKERYTKKERGYVGREFNYNKRPMLMLGPNITVKPIGKPVEQLELF